MKGMNASDRNSLNLRLDEAGLAPLEQDQIDQFNRYLDLILKWNSRTNLTAVREPGEIIDRHFIESIFCARMLPGNLASLLDLGSGAGIPGIPIAVCRPDLDVTLAESQNKKAAFLNEAVRVLELNVKVFSGRAETLNSTFDCVALRAVDKMCKAIEIAISLLRPMGMLVLMASDPQKAEFVSLAGVTWRSPVRIPGSKHRVICLGTKD